MTNYTLRVTHSWTRDICRGHLTTCIARAVDYFDVPAIYRVEIVGLWQAERHVTGWEWRFGDDEWRPLTPEHIVAMDQCGRLPIVSDDDLDLGRIPIGGRLPIRGQEWILTGRTPKTWTFTVDGWVRRIRLHSERWFEFARDVASLYTSSRHGVDGGCLTDLWPPEPTLLKLKKLAP